MDESNNNRQLKERLGPTRSQRKTKHTRHVLRKRNVLLFFASLLSFSLMLSSNVPALFVTTQHAPKRNMPQLNWNDVVSRRFKCIWTYCYYDYFFLKYSRYVVVLLHGFGNSPRGRFAFLAGDKGWTDVISCKRSWRARIAKVAIGCASRYIVFKVRLFYSSLSCFFFLLLYRR